MKKILVLVASETNLPIIKAAKLAGCYVITCDNNPNNIGHKFADENLFIDVYDEQLILEKTQNAQLDAVVAFASGRGLKTATVIAEKYKLKGYTIHTLKTLSDKGLFRDFLKKNNLNYPGYQRIEEIEQIQFNKLIYPAIIKPTDKGGSKGVKIVNNKNDLIRFFPIAKKTSDSGSVIIEEFIEGKALINGDCLVQNGELIVSFIGDYIYDPEVSDVLPIATIFPTRHHTQKVTDQLNSIIKLLDIPDGIINFEAIIKGYKPYIIEINPRPSGNYIWKLMGYHYGFDVPQYLINLYLNNKPSLAQIINPNGHEYAYQLLYSLEQKTLGEITLPQEVKKSVLDFILFKKPGEVISPFTNLFNRAGIALLEFQNENDKNFYYQNMNHFKI